MNTKTLESQLLQEKLNPFDFNKSYPIQFIEPVQLKDGTLIQLRPIHPIDGSQAVIFQDKLSTQSIYNRFLGYIPRISDKLIDQLTNIDYSKEMAIVAEIQHQKEKEVIAVGRVAGDQELGADIAVIIADAWQGKGLGTILTDYMIDIAIEMKFKMVYGYVFSSNVKMLEILRHKGFVFTKDDEQTMYVELPLTRKRNRS